MAAAEMVVPRVSARQLSRSEAELEWWHTTCGSDLGERCQGYEPHPWIQFGRDSSGSMLEAMGERRHAVDKFTRIAPRIRALSSWHRELAGAIYTPRPYPPHLRELWPCDRHVPGLFTLVGAVLYTAAIHEAFEASHGGKQPNGANELLLWAADATRPRVQKGKHVNERKPRWAKAAHEQAYELRREVLTAYAMVSS